jgi:hypothetical protein
LSRLARSISAGVSDATSAAFTTSDVSGPRQQRINGLVVVQDAVLLQEADRVRQPFSEFGELIAEEVGLGEPNVVDDGLDASLGDLSVLDLDGSISGHRINGEAVTLEEDRDVGRASRGNASGVNVGQRSSETVVDSGGVSKDNIIVENIDHFVSVASAPGFGELEDSTLNSALVSNEDRTVVDDTLRQLVAPAEGFSLGSDERNSSASENDKKKSLVHLCCCC